MALRLLPIQVAPRLSITSAYLANRAPHAPPRVPCRGHLRAARFGTTLTQTRSNGDEGDWAGGPHVTGTHPSVGRSRGRRKFPDQVAGRHRRVAAGDGRTICELLFPTFSGSCRQLAHCDLHDRIFCRASPHRSHSNRDLHRPRTHSLKRAGPSEQK